MPVIIEAHGDPVSGWVRLSFPKDDKIRKLIKEFPGTKWGPYQGVPNGPWKGTKCPANAKCQVDQSMASGLLPVNRDETVECKNPSHRAWFIPQHSFGIIKEAVEARGHRVRERWEAVRLPGIPEVIARRLREYQFDTAQFMSHVGRRHLLAFDPRVGKTPTSIGAACGLLAAGEADLAIVIYPAGVRGEWQDQLKAWANTDLEALETFKSLPDEEIAALRARRFLFVGCHYEILSQREADLGRLVDGRRYVVIVDEIQNAANRRIGRTHALQRLSRGVPLIHKGDLPEENQFANGQCVALWGLTGTPMRNKPANLWAPFDIIIPGSMASYWRYARRYANAHENEIGVWDDSGESNPEELSARLKAVWTRKTRAEVAPWLPKSTRVPIVCSATAEQMKRYRALERQYGGRVLKALESDDPTGSERALIETLAAATMEAKIPAGVARMIEVHASAGNKVLGFAHHHQTLRDIEAACEDIHAQRKKDGLPMPEVFVAGGWLSPSDRREVIASWKAAADVNGMGSILLVNSKSSGVGIDLSEALVSVFFEFEYVPADFRQAEDRIQDIHKGTNAGRGRLFEYLMVPGTVDEAMILALLRKIGSIGRIVGLDAELDGMATALKSAGVVDDGRLGLPNTDRETIQAALASIRDRLLLGDDASEEETLAADAESLEDEIDDAPGDEDLPF